MWVSYFIFEKNWSHGSIFLYFSLLIFQSNHNLCNTVEGGELGRWCELGQNFSDSSPLLLLVKGHWCAILRKCSAL